MLKNVLHKEWELHNYYTMNNKRKLKPIAIVLFITIPIVLAILGVGTVGFITVRTQKKQEKLRLEREAYEKEQREAQEAYEKEQELLRYQEAYNQIVKDMMDSALIAEKDGNLLKTVWYNTIFQVRDSSTDPYTMVDGKFETNFDVTLERLFDDEDYGASIAELAQSKAKIKEDMKAMVNPPEEYEEAYKPLKEMYDSYLEFTDLVLNPKGSLKEFNEAFLEADKEMGKKYNDVELYVR